ncbi:hypothetical protein ACU5P1_10725 [Pseudomonas plecoglossicida]|uniref:hypothetical protein n=1 Tax=Pseudomonas plecoglossicida TaxID=70775 RepID=UPI0011839664|nr:hypothetical protein [Pseudomonas plecoglossicida]QLB55262.1 hypothetical protein HAV28_10650 [Pseudomonas plecoglossicida]
MGNENENDADIDPERLKKLTGTKPANSVRNYVLATAAVIAFIATLTGNIEKITDSASRLIPSLATYPRLLVDERKDGFVSALNGYEPALVNKDVIYIAGAKITLPLRHDRKSSQTIVIDKIKLLITHFSPGKNKELSYKADTDKIRGAGPATPDVFRVVVSDGKILKASWVLQNGAIAQQKSPSSDILDVDPPVYFKLMDNSNEDTLLLVGYVIPVDTGLYSFEVAIKYSTGGSSENEEKLGPFYVYNE